MTRFVPSFTGLIALSNLQNYLLAFLVCSVSSFPQKNSFLVTKREKQRFTQPFLSAAAKSQEPWNPFSSMVGDIASSILGKAVDGSSSSQRRVNDALSKVSSATTWDNIRSVLESMQTTEERQFRQNLEKGYGIGSPQHKVRLFDESNKEEDVRVTFYRDSASWCPYCQKVWLALEEKRIPYRVEKVNMRCYGDKPASFMRMQPSGQIPVAIIDGRVYGQSNDILYALEEMFPDHKSLLPKGRDAEGQELLRLERQVFSAWMYWLTSSGDYRKMFTDTLSKVESALNRSGPFFLGKEVSLVDFMYAPFLERMAASLLYYKGFMMRVPPEKMSPYPALNLWFDAMETLPSYQLVKSDYYTHCWDLPPQLGGCTYEAAGEPYQKAINGERSIVNNNRGSWELPLEPHNGGVEPDWDVWAGDEMTARREAVERVSANFEAIVKFAARGAGRKGIPPVSAPLADPNAQPSEAVQEAVDSIMKEICMALLEGVDKRNTSMEEIANTIVQSSKDDRLFTDGVIASLSYLRDRVGVPRDMKLPAARQLRAHLNWAIEKLLTAQE